MRCPFCHHSDTQVRDSRVQDEGMTMRRRRYCSNCGSRFTTIEHLHRRDLIVIKRDGKKRPFNADKLRRSLQTALRKRPIAIDTIETKFNQLLTTIESSSENEITSEQIGRQAMEMLAKLDSVAYIRFASVYHDFETADDFHKLLNEIAASSTLPSSMGE